MNAKLLPGDYYYEDGLMVFTDAFLRRRGACCRIGCRHCPWKSAEQATPSSASACKSHVENSNEFTVALVDS